MKLDWMVSRYCELFRRTFMTMLTGLKTCLPFGRRNGLPVAEGHGLSFKSVRARILMRAFGCRGTWRRHFGQSFRI